MIHCWGDINAILPPQINAEGRHVYPFDPFFPLDVRFFRWGRHAEVVPNLHDYLELLYVYSGELVFEVQNRRMPVRTGDLCIIGSELLHRFSGHRMRTAKMVAAYFLPWLILEGASPEEAECLMPFFAQEETSGHVIPAKSGLPRRVFRLMLRMHAELHSGQRLNRLAAKTLLYEALILIARHYPRYPHAEQIFNRRKRMVEQMRGLFEYVDRHYAEPIRLRDAARVAGTSQPNFVRLFKELTGQPFKAYLKQFRIAKAQELLSSTDKPIAEISQEVGFCDQSYFGSVFHRLVRLTPRQFRQRARRTEYASAAPEAPSSPAAYEATPTRQSGRVGARLRRLEQGRGGLAACSAAG